MKILVFSLLFFAVSIVALAYEVNRRCTYSATRHETGDSVVRDYNLDCHSN